MSMIYGGDVRLRAVEREDVKLFHKWINDPEVTQSLSMYLPQSINQEEKWFERIAEREAHERPFSIELRHKDGWKLIGSCGVFGIEWPIRSAEVGIMIGEKSVWNRGHGTQVMILLLRHCFETLNLNRVFLNVYGDNARARRTYEKVGFRQEGCLRQAAYRNGKYDDVIIMSVLRSEWDARKTEG